MEPILVNKSILHKSQQRKRLSYDTNIYFKGQRTTAFKLVGSRGGDKEYG